MLYMTDPFVEHYNGHSMLNALNSCHKKKKQERKEPISFIELHHYPDLFEY